MKCMLNAACAILILCVNKAGTQEPKKPSVTLTLTRVRGIEFYSTPLEGPMKGQKVRGALLVCDVVLDNQTGDDLTVLSNFFSAFDGLNIALLKDGKEIRNQCYNFHQSPYSAEGRPFVLKKGKNDKQMRFPISVVPDDWAGFEVKIIGKLPGSKFKGVLTSETKKIERVADYGDVAPPYFDPPAKPK